MEVTTDVLYDYLHEYMHYDDTKGILIYKKLPAKCRSKLGDVLGYKEYYPDKDKFYYRAKILGKTYLIHNLIWVYTKREMPVWPNRVDHIDRDTLNNKITNLRIATASENKANGKAYKNNKVGLKGVSRQSSGKFISRITKNSVTKHLGTFSTPEEAAMAYDKAAKELYGEFACLNFPDNM